jgi:hypothetical protein
VASVDNSSKRTGNADGNGTADTGGKTLTAITATARLHSIAASSSVTFDCDEGAPSLQRSTASSHTESSSAMACSIDKSGRSVATVTISEAPGSVNSLHMIPAVLLTLVTLILVLWPYKVACRPTAFILRMRRLRQKTVKRLASRPGGSLAWIIEKCTLTSGHPVDRFYQ